MCASISPVALRLPGLQTGVATRSPEKVRSTASGKIPDPAAWFVNISNTYRTNSSQYNCPY
ncbi:hypothetical protein [Klebsiella sp. 141130]|uniref:hypothetical protein n=1 Tax=Klebsiella TaxID=570 RepID=UPI003D339B2A